MARTTVDPDFLSQLQGYGLTTAEFSYYWPDAPHVLCPNTIIQQFLDIHPKFPRLQQFLDFWGKNIEARLSHVKVAHAHLIAPVEFRIVGTELRLH